MKKIKAFLILVFLISLSLPMIFLNTKTDQVSLLDNRKLVELPKYEGITDNYLKDVSKYLDDRYGGRSDVINSYARINDKLFSDMVHPTYTYGKDGHVFFKMKEEKQYTDYHDYFAQTIVNMKNYIESKGGKFYVMINPEKTAVYQDYLPAGVSYNRKWLETFENKLASGGVKFLDTKNLLIEKSKEKDVYNRKYDAGHWNDWGAFYAVNGMLDLLKNDFPNTRMLTEDMYDVKNKVETSLKVSEFPINEDTPNLVLKNDKQYKNIKSEYASVKINPDYPTFNYFRNTSKEAEKMPRALVFQGSYLNDREKFFKPAFKDYVSIHNYQNIFAIDEYYNIFKMDIVILELAEYTFTETFFHSGKMEYANEQMKKASKK